MLRIITGLVVWLLLISGIKAQSFGFGCFGFVSGFGGYSYQRFEPKGLNDYIKVFNRLREDSLVTPMSDFGTASGYRVGVNFFRAKVDNFVLTTKGYYQSISEKHESLEKFTSGTRTTSMKLDLRNFGIGIDVGISITKWASWKIIDGAVHINNAILTNTENSTGAQTVVKKYRTESTSVGYSIGTGFIFEIIDDYVSIEGAAGYTQIKIDNLQLDDGTLLTRHENTTDPMKDFIDTGGFNAVIQLNIGFPL
jgi:hypothetical protein